MNKLVDYLIEAAFFLVQNSSINQIDSKQLAYEVYRALGALIYQNGFKLNVLNLNRLFGSNDSVIANRKTRQDLGQKDGLLFLVREQVEEDLAEMASLGRVSDELEFELNNKLNLISVQLIYNLTMPNEINSDEKSSGAGSQAPLKYFLSFLFLKAVINAKIPKHFKMLKLIKLCVYFNLISNLIILTRTSLFRV